MPATAAMDVPVSLGAGEHPGRTVAVILPELARQRPDDQRSLTLVPPMLWLQPPITQMRSWKTTLAWPLRGSHWACPVAGLQVAPSADHQTSFRLPSPAPSAPSVSPQPPS